MPAKTKSPAVPAIRPLTLSELDVIAGGVRGDDDGCIPRPKGKGK
jgi:hypothetical protein